MFGRLIVKKAPMNTSMKGVRNFYADVQRYHNKHDELEQTVQKLQSRSNKLTLAVTVGFFAVTGLYLNELRSGYNKYKETPKTNAPGK